ncbi:MAG: hypothetical protein IJ802_04325 [Kiritimatiellae bacterium]|nr:hypothetical protein [Kiritimatiellia bacterium]
MLLDPFIKKRHAWTSDPLPWDIADSTDAQVRKSSKGWPFTLLGVGGLRTFGSTNAAVLRNRRQDRFLAIACTLIAAWLVFMFI